MRVGCEWPSVRNGFFRAPVLKHAKDAIVICNTIKLVKCYGLNCLPQFSTSNLGMAAKLRRWMQSNPTPPH
jgi:hypothetical protein